MHEMSYCPSGAPSSAALSTSIRSLFLLPMIRSVFFRSISVICSQFPILDIVPSLLTTIGPRASSFTVSPPLDMSILMASPSLGGAGSPNGTPPESPDSTLGSTSEDVAPSNFSLEAMLLADVLNAGVFSRVGVKARLVPGSCSDVDLSFRSLIRVLVGSLICRARTSTNIVRMTMVRPVRRSIEKLLQDVALSQVSYITWYLPSPRGRRYLSFEDYASFART